MFFEGCWRILSPHLIQLTVSCLPSFHRTARNLQCLTGSGAGLGLSSILKIPPSLYVWELELFQLARASCNGSQLLPHHAPSSGAFSIEAGCTIMIYSGMHPASQSQHALIECGGSSVGISPDCATDVPTGKS